MESLHTLYNADKSKRMQIFADQDPQNPRTEFDNATKFAFSHRRYTMPNEGNVPFEELHFDIANVTKWLRANADAKLVRVVSMHDHSGVNFYLGDPQDRWDSGRVGFIYITNKVAKENGWVGRGAIKKMEAAMQADLKTYTQFCNGEVYGYVIQAQCGDCQEYTKHVDSCWGFYDFDSMAENAPEFKAELAKL